MVDQSLFGPLFPGEYLGSTTGSGVIRYVDPIHLGEYQGTVAQVQAELGVARTVVPSFTFPGAGSTSDASPWLLVGAAGIIAVLLLRRSP